MIGVVFSTRIDKDVRVESNYQSPTRNRRFESNSPPSSILKTTFSDRDEPSLSPIPRVQVRQSGSESEFESEYFASNFSSENDSGFEHNSNIYDNPVFHV